MVESLRIDIKFVRYDKNQLALIDCKIFLNKINQKSFGVLNFTMRHKVRCHEYY